MRRDLASQIFCGVDVSYMFMSRRDWGWISTRQEKTHVTFIENLEKRRKSAMIQSILVSDEQVPNSHVKYEFKVLELRKSKPYTLMYVMSV